MAESKVYSLGTASVSDVVSELENFFKREKGMEVQSAPLENGYIIQAGQSKDILRSISGMRIATSVQLSVLDSGELNVTVGEGQWADKLGVGAVGLFFLWPLAITAGIGAYKQKMLPNEIFDFVGRFLQSPGQAAAQSFSNSPSASQAAPAASSTVCPSCGAVLSFDSKFCNKCGAKLTSVCPGCGAPVTPESKFCSQCGTAL